jgi:hypothetical protein
MVRLSLSIQKILVPCVRELFDYTRELVPYLVRSGRTSYISWSTGVHVVCIVF